MSRVAWGEAHVRWHPTFNVQDSPFLAQSLVPLCSVASSLSRAADSPTRSHTQCLLAPRALSPVDVMGRRINARCCCERLPVEIGVALAGVHETLGCSSAGHIIAKAFGPGMGKSSSRSRQVFMEPLLTLGALFQAGEWSRTRQTVFLSWRVI